MVSWKVIKKVLRRIKKYWFFLVLSVFMAIITVASTLYVPILIGKAIDYIVGENNVDFENIKSILFTIAVFIGITALSQWIMNI